MRTQEINPELNNIARRILDIAESDIRQELLKLYKKLTNKSDNDIIEDSELDEFCKSDAGAKYADFALKSLVMCDIIADARNDAIMATNKNFTNTNKLYRDFADQSHKTLKKTIQECIRSLYGVETSHPNIDYNTEFFNQALGDAISSLDSKIQSKRQSAAFLRIKIMNYIIIDYLNNLYKLNGKLPKTFFKDVVCETLIELINNAIGLMKSVVGLFNGANGPAAIKQNNNFHLERLEHIKKLEESLIKLRTLKEQDHEGQDHDGQYDEAAKHLKEVFTTVMSDLKRLGDRSANHSLHRLFVDTPWNAWQRVLDYIKQGPVDQGSIYTLIKNMDAEYNKLTRHAKKMIDEQYPGTTGLDYKTVSERGFATALHSRLIADIKGSEKGGGGKGA
ncbi:hypothetical protein Cyrtocomes_00712 [Candidatus Cyrtobacter comes]|uniref:Uncharacterized protein n=1 Tax=Candidatus Cyrtobacter comes TaxID=675776 RepID=A0ABU5L883_9RICK|nr:hypothetical protein [Candidatus Cyrtobacter comes]MDZ5762333.1 hypothetical protein [Candidatus Cyrtobacter comes]